MKRIKKPLNTALVLAALSLTNHVARAAYSEPASYTNAPTTITLGSPGYETTGADDSAAFSDAINDVAAAGGGIVWVPEGDYSLVGVEMKSNVHLRIRTGSILRMQAEGLMFWFGGGIENVSIRGAGGRFTVNMGNFDTSRFITGNGVDNMLVANIDIEDPHETVYSSISLGWDRIRDETPSNVTVRNISCLNKEHYGYGIIQAQAASDSFFTNLEGHGGVPVRLETGWKLMNLAKRGGVFNIKATNITSKDGQAAVMMQPHTITNGDVFINHVNSVGSEFTVVLEKGGTWKYSAQEVQDYGLATGTFGMISVGNAHGAYHSSGVPTRYSRLDNYTPSELQKVFRDPGKISGHSGPSIAVVGNYGDSSSLTTWNISGTGGYVNPLISDEDDEYNHSSADKKRPSL
ncbi:hypothetical protein ACFSSA_01025 [Luteolibacter algae]|uniref:Pectate lyase superfamily protein domain-containing protein n=1 Tax=Luteolibacter algae TaxID=454151 RepID=A0ABW5D3D6_9BACT